MERLLFFFGKGEGSCWLLRLAILSICCFVYLEMVFSCTGFLTRVVTPGTADRWFKISSTRKGRSLATCLRTKESCDQYPAFFLYLDNDIYLQHHPLYQ